MNQVIRLNEDKYDKQCLEVLLNNRLIQPKRDEWIEATKIIKENEETLKEKELKRIAFEERKKECENFKKQKEEQKKLAEVIKQEIKSDAEYRKKKYE